MADASNLPDIFTEPQWGIINKWLVDLAYQFTWKEFQATGNVKEYPTRDFLQGALGRCLHSSEAQSKEASLVLLMCKVADGELIDTRYIGNEDETPLEGALQAFMDLRKKLNLNRESGEEIMDAMKKQAVFVCVKAGQFEKAKLVLDRVVSNFGEPTTFKSIRMMLKQKKVNNNLMKQSYQSFVKSLNTVLEQVHASIPEAFIIKAAKSVVDKGASEMSRMSGKKKRASETTVTELSQPDAATFKRKRGRPRNDDPHRKTASHKPKFTGGVSTRSKRQLADDSMTTGDSQSVPDTESDAGQTVLRRTEAATELRSQPIPADKSSPRKTQGETGDQKQETEEMEETTETEDVETETEDGSFVLGTLYTTDSENSQPQDTSVEQSVPPENLKKTRGSPRKRPAPTDGATVSPSAATDSLAKGNTETTTEASHLTSYVEDGVSPRKKRGRSDQRTSQSEESTVVETEGPPDTHQGLSFPLNRVLSKDNILQLQQKFGIQSVRNLDEESQQALLRKIQAVIKKKHMLLQQVSGLEDLINTGKDVSQTEEIEDESAERESENDISLDTVLHNTKKQRSEVETLTTELKKTRAKVLDTDDEEDTENIPEVSRPTLRRSRHSDIGTNGHSFPKLPPTHQMPPEMEKLSSENQSMRDRSVSSQSSPSKLRRFWTDWETEQMYKGVQKCGVGKWAAVLAEAKLHPRTSVHIKDRWRTLNQTGLIEQLIEKFGPY